MSDDEGYFVAPPWTDEDELRYRELVTHVREPLEGYLREVWRSLADRYGWVSEQIPEAEINLDVARPGRDLPSLCCSVNVYPGEVDALVTLPANWVSRVSRWSIIDGVFICDVLEFDADGVPRIVAAPRPYPDEYDDFDGYQMEIGHGEVRRDADGRLTLTNWVEPGELFTGSAEPVEPPDDVDRYAFGSPNGKPSAGPGQPGA